MDNKLIKAEVSISRNHQWCLTVSVTPIRAEEKLDSYTWLVWNYWVTVDEYKGKVYLANKIAK